MRFLDLHIETRRERPAKARSDGEALLIRAGYVDSAGGLTPLGLRSARRIAAATQDGRQLDGLGAPVVRTITGDSFAVSQLGDVSMLHCQNCGYASDADTAAAAKSVQPPQAELPLERVETPGCRTIESLAAFLGVPPSRTAKALLYSRPDAEGLVFVMIRGDMQLAVPKLRTVVGDLQPATPEQIANAGAVPGYASPIGASGALVVVDDLIAQSANLVAGANMEGFHFRNTNLGRDYTADRIIDLTLASAGDPCSQCGSPLRAVTGLILADKGKLRADNALRLLAEHHHDERGLHLPAAMAPFDVYLLHIHSHASDIRSMATEMHEAMEASGVSVLLDDREVRAGVKFNDADLIGCPIRLTMGEKHLRDGMVEFQDRIAGPAQLLPLPDLVRTVRSLVPLQP